MLYPFTSFVKTCVVIACVTLWACEEQPESRTDTSDALEVQADAEDEFVHAAPIDLAIDGVADESVFVDIERGETALRRLTRAEFVSAIKGVLGDVVVPGIAEPDVARGGLKSIGASWVTYTARGVESVENAVYDIAKQVISDPSLRDRNLPCSPSSARDDECARTTLLGMSTLAWRRPVESSELDAIVDVVGRASAELDSFHEGLVYGMAAIFQSPEFLYRYEVGTGSASSTQRVLTDHELAARLSFFLWNQPPDDRLRKAADAGELSTRAGLFAQAKRLLNDPKARHGIRALFNDYLKLYELDHLAKDPTVFEHFNDRLGEYAREETLQLIEDLVFETPRDFRQLLTTRVTYINPMLASIYQVPALAEQGFSRVELPAAMGRAGMLGHVSFLAVHAHSRSSSATRRGLAVRTILLCQAIPAPPVDVDTSIPEPSAEVQTLRDRVQEHLENPSCAGCHQLTDPIGLGLENFDGIGRYRETEYGTTIDPAGKLDGQAFENAVELGERIRNHHDFAPCIVKVLSRYAIGRTEGGDESDWLDVLTERFQHHGYQLKPLILELVMSPLFRSNGALKEAQ
ncbi:MAG: DUF1592 domain-containing protein [Myxococcota bacterium]|nr:DUF1592 domain-containing protein [Myxococcota bacterium]